MSSVPQLQFSIILFAKQLFYFMRQIYFNSEVRRFLENSLIHLPRQRCDLFHIMQLSANLGAVSQGEDFDWVIVVFPYFLSIEWNSIRLGGPACRIVGKTIHKVLPGSLEQCHLKPGLVQLFPVRSLLNLQEK